jgi:hypothetical protein
MIAFTFLLAASLCTPGLCSNVSTVMPAIGFDTTEDTVAVEGQQDSQHGYRSVQKRTQDETNALYGYVFDRGTAARIESAKVEPGILTTADQALISINYMVFTHSRQPVLVREIREVWLEDAMRKRFENQVERKGGTFESTVALDITEDLEPGVYRAVCVVQTPHSRDLWETRFIVLGR